MLNSPEPDKANRERGGSLHDRIISEIKDKIMSREWMPGRRIPYEHELMEQYGCSRMTINKAITALVRTGLIERRRKAGSFVKNSQSRPALLEIHNVEEEVTALGLPYSFKIVSQKERAFVARDSGRIDLAKKSQLLEIVCTHYAGKRPFCLEDRLINLEAVPEARVEDFSKIPPGAWLRQRVPWSIAEHVIRSMGADDKMSMHLNVPKGDPCLVVQRKTWSETQQITFVRLSYRNEHTLVAKFAP